MSGAIGRVISVDFSWYLDVTHGADYFRRWHRLKSKGGSLWVHKASHHFDLINWWLDADPVEVSAEAGLEAGTFTVSRGVSLSTPLTVNYSVSGGATSGSDFISIGTSATQCDHSTSRQS